ncbi:MAG: B12-binding domain-containing radical SAM protein [Treponema sp.]|nr:B12-binding domain-containing radical SAM protein [Treponema sp.]
MIDNKYKHKEISHKEINIVLTTINAKWIHPSLALRLLKANLGDLEPNCEIMEFNLRQPLCEKVEPLLAANPKILGISVSIWNHLATIELLEALEKEWIGAGNAKPVVALGGPEVSHLPADAEIFKFADHVIRGEGEIAFRLLCEDILREEVLAEPLSRQLYEQRSRAEEIKSAYHLYSDEDVVKKLIYVESSRGCPFKCDFCLSSIDEKICEFPLEPFLSEMDILIQRGVKTFKFLDRSFNTNIKRALKIINFFLNKIEQPPPLPYPCKSVKSALIRGHCTPTVHFEMVPSIFPDELIDALSRFPPGTLRLEIGFQTLNLDVSARINRPSNPEKELENLKFLVEKTSAIIHADLIAGLPGEDIESFGEGFDRLWLALRGKNIDTSGGSQHAEIQLGILKQIPGTPISRHNEAWKMRFNPLPPYEIEENSTISSFDLLRLKNFARFWEQTVNRNLLFPGDKPVFKKFLVFSDALYAHFGRNWGIDKADLMELIKNTAF